MFDSYVDCCSVLAVVPCLGCCGMAAGSLHLYKKAEGFGYHQVSGGFCFFLPDRKFLPFGEKCCAGCARKCRYIMSLRRRICGVCHMVVVV